MMRGLREWKYLALLAALVVAAILEPLSVTWPERAQIIGGMAVLMLNVPVFLVVFETRWERVLAFCLLPPLVAANLVHEVVADCWQIGAVVFHCFITMFLALAVAVILKRIFQHQAIRTDDVIGVLCGYLLAAVAWGNAYAVVYRLWPASFRVADASAWQLADWHWQRYLFNYFSVMTLS
jgi:hypothetical protein